MNFAQKLFLGLFVLLVSLPVLAHHEWNWMNEHGIKNPVTKRDCCDDRDCYKIFHDEISKRGKKYIIKFRGKTYYYPSNQVLISKDGNMWMCLDKGSNVPRCLFLLPEIS